MDHPTLRVGPVVVDFRPLRETAEAIARGELTGDVHLCNAYTLSLADERTDVAASLSDAAANLPDGTPLVWWARHCGIDAERVYGPDLMESVLDVGRAHGTAHFLYGSTSEVLDELTAAIQRRWPGTIIAGVESPPFRELTDDELRASVDAATTAGARVVWVGMGTPKQDLIVAEMARHRSDVAFVAIGAAFDFIAGTKPQAPRWMMRWGLEWLYRLISEPRRLWRRYLVHNARFVRLLWHDHRRARAATAL